MNTIFHADDFGITVNQSRLILSTSTLCGGSGVLNSTSVLVNSPQFDRCAALLDECPSDFHVGLHINVVEGHCVAPAAEIPLLIDENGMFKMGFGRMLLEGLGSNRTQLTGQLRIEIGAQIRRFITRFPAYKQALRLDSHQHFHMIPAVMEATLSAADDLGCTIEYLRIPAEPLTPFVRTPGIWFKIAPINWVKHWLLNLLWRRCKSRGIMTRHGFTPDVLNRVSAVFCGINFSGHMFADRAGAVAPAFTGYAQQHTMQVEFLFHPGGYTDVADALNPALDGFVAFYTSSNRAQEAHALQWFETHNC